MTIILFDNQHRQKLFPLVINKPIARLQTGINTTEQRWQLFTKLPIALLTTSYLQSLYPMPSIAEALYIDAAAVPNEQWMKAALSLNYNQAIVNKELQIVAYYGSPQWQNNKLQFPTPLHSFLFDISIITYPWQLLQYHTATLNFDIELLFQHSTQQSLPAQAKTSGNYPIFIHPNAQVEHAYLNAKDGPIAIGADTLIQDGAMIRGNVSIGNNCVVKMGAKIYGSSSFGNNCLINGEIKNSIMHNYSNKAHDGYLGDSIIGEFCNFGAGTTNSNLKNSGGTVKVFNEAKNEFVAVGNKFGVIMGDYTRTSINSSINTGSNYGIGCNVFGSGLLPKMLPHFSWGIDAKYKIDKAIQDIATWKNFKNQQLSTEEVAVLKYIYQQQQ